MKFTCNLCGNETEQNEGFHREGGACRSCGSNVRFRVLMLALSNELFGRPIALADFPEHKEIRGLGLSDAPHYAAGLERCFSYVNYFYHTEPFLDIRRPDPALYGQHDFLISSDVFEHVPPPRTTPFVEAWKLLKPGGLLVFSVPYTNLPKTFESYPDLQEFEIVETAQGHRLINRDSSGRTSVYSDLFWHGGPGDTLELRVYCRKHLEFLLQSAGFSDIRFHESDLPASGIIQSHQEHSFILTARRPHAPGTPPPADPAEEASFLYSPSDDVRHGMIHRPTLVTEMPDPEQARSWLLSLPPLPATSSAIQEDPSARKRQPPVIADMLRRILGILRRRFRL